MHTIISGNGENVTDDGLTACLRIMMPKQNAFDLRVTQNTCTCTRPLKNWFQIGTDLFTFPKIELLSLQLTQHIFGTSRS